MITDLRMGVRCVGFLKTRFLIPTDVYLLKDQLQRKQVYIVFWAESGIYCDWDLQKVQ